METFTVGTDSQWDGNMIFTFRSNGNGRFLAAESNGDLNVNRGHAVTWEAFQVIPLSESKSIEKNLFILQF